MDMRPSAVVSDAIHFNPLISLPSPRLCGDPSRIVFSHKKIEAAGAFDAPALVFDGPLPEVFSVNNDAELRSYRVVAQVGRQMAYARPLS